MRSTGKPYVSWRRNARSPSSCGASSGRSSGRRPTARSVVASAARASSRWIVPASSVRANCASSRAMAARISSLPGDEVRIRLAHDLDDRRGEVAQERLAPAEQPAVADGPAEDPAQHVAAALVGRQDVVGDEERDGARVVGDHLVAEALGFEVLGVVPQDLAQPVVDRREQVRVVVGRDLLEDAREALQAHPGVDARERQRHAAVRALVELHEHEVPDLQPARAHARSGRARSPAPRRGGARDRSGSRCTDRTARCRPSARSCCRRRCRRRPSGHPLGRQADLVAPDVPRDVVVRVGRGRQPIVRDAEVARQEVPGPVDRLALEVVAEAPVAEHLEERVVARRPPDLLEVVVLAGDPQDALVVDGPRVRARLGPGQDVLELDHARSS